MTNQCIQCGVELPDTCPVCRRRATTIRQTPYTPEDQRWLAPVRNYEEKLQVAVNNGYASLAEFIRAVYWQWGSGRIVGYYLNVSSVNALQLIRKSGCEVRPQGGANFVGKKI